MNSENGQTGTHYRTCPFCEAICGLEIETSGEKVVSIKGDTRDVLSGGFLCTKGLAIGDLHHDPDRIKKPLIKQEDGGFQEASWDEAFALIEKNMNRVIDEHGRDALGIYLGNPNVHNISLAFYTGALIRAMRTKNIYSASSVDQLPKQVSSGLMFGTSLSVPIPDLDRTDYMLMLGANPMVSNGSLWTSPDVPGRLRKLKERGGKLVVLDPRLTITARQADEHLYITPGADAYFLFGIIHTLFEEKLTDTGDLTEHLLDLEKVEELAKEFSPEVVAPRCGIDADTIRRITREFAAAKSAICYGRIGTCTQEFGATASWLLDVVNILTGNLDKPGGVMFPMPLAGSSNTGPKTGKEKGVKVDKRKSRVRGLPLIYGETPVACLAEEIETEGKGQIKAMFIIAGNPLVSTPDTERLTRAFEKLDFMVSLDIYQTASNYHADVILPGLSPLEDSHYDFAFGSFMVRNAGNYSPPVFEKSPEQLAEWEILLRLAAILSGKGPDVDIKETDAAGLKGWVQAMGHRVLGEKSADDIVAALGDEPGPDRILDFLLRAGPYGDQFGAQPDGVSLARLKENPHGIDRGPMEPRIPEVLRTASGKIEMAPPVLVKDVERLRTKLGAESPRMVLIGRRHIKSNNSWMHNIERLAKGETRSALMVNPADAGELGLADGGRALVSSRVGKLEAPVQVTSDIMPGVACLPHGWTGHGGNGKGSPIASQKVASKYPGVNTNILADTEGFDPVSGNAILDGIPISIQPA